MHPAPVDADRRRRDARRGAIMTDDGFNIGVLYAGDRPAVPRRIAEPARKMTPADLEAEFEL